MAMEQFVVKYDKENDVNGKTYIEVPFNVWEVFNQKGRVKVKGTINESPFKCTLIPKGKGLYVLLLTKKMIADASISSGDQITISISPDIEATVQIDVTKPRMKIKGINFMKQPTSKSCGQTCVAMLANKSVEEVFEDFGKRPIAMGKIFEILAEYQIGHGEKNRRISKKYPKPADISILTLKMKDHSHYVVYYYGKYYDPSRGVLDECPEGWRVSTFLEIYSE